MSTAETGVGPQAADVVIVGAGQAGYQTAASLRQYGFAGRITLISDQVELPYQRPPLSKAYLLGRLDERRLLHRQEKWYPDQGVELVRDGAVGIDRAGHEVVTAGGARVPYGHLVLATGARNRPLPVPGAALCGVTGLRDKSDADALSTRLVPGARVVVVGAGFIGLEFAAVAAARGASVHVMEIADRPMARAVSAPTGAYFRAAQESWGVRFDFGQGLASIDGDAGRVTSVTTSDGRRLPADLVVYGIGVLPNTALAGAAGLMIAEAGGGGGIRVDASLVTSDADVSAAGDAVSFPCAQLGGALTRLESVQNAADHGRHVAARIMGRADAYRTLPWFWSDQGDERLQIAGLAQGHDRVVDLAAGAGKVVLCFAGDRLVAVETVNRPGEHMAARRILATDDRPSFAEASAPGFELIEWEKSRACT